MVTFQCCLSGVQLGCKWFPSGFIATGHDIISDCCGSTRTIKDASISRLNLFSLLVCITPPSGKDGSDSILHVSSFALEGTGPIRQGSPTGRISFHKVVSTDAFLSGWEALCDRSALRRVWPPIQRRRFHINYLELLTVFRHKIFQSKPPMLYAGK